MSSQEQSRNNAGTAQERRRSRQHERKATRSIQEQLRSRPVAGMRRPGGTKSNQEQPGAARSNQVAGLKQPVTSRSSLGTARSSSQQQLRNS